ncbi:hypothetical protein ABPG75_006308 [Micractinium tetrahymenae]
MASPLIPTSEGKVVPDSRQGDEQELAQLREMAGEKTLSARRHAYLESLPRPAPDPLMEAELDAAAVPSPTAGRLVVEGDDLLEDPDNPWSHSNVERNAEESTARP